MPDANQTNQGVANTQQSAANSTGATIVADTGSGATSDDNAIVDPKKSPEQYIKDIENQYIVPSLVRNKFPDLVKLIYETESMNTEEREYWLQIMPIMSEDQIKKFRDILVNEKDQLARLDREYNNEMSRINAGSSKPIDEAKLKAKMETIKKAEEESQVEEEGEEEKLLDELENL